jgi:hypothetical protein
MPKHKASYDIDTDSLEEIAVLFIPFDAAGKFYKANAVKGVEGFKGFLDDTGRPQDTDESRSLVGGHMGYFQADAATLTLVGPSLYGQLGASGSRSFLGGGKYYSDHPSIDVRVQSERLTQEAQDAIFKRKIVKVRRKMQMS